MKFQITKRTAVLVLLAAIISHVAIAAPRRKKASAAELMTQAREAFYAYNPTLASEKIAELERLRKGVDADSLADLRRHVERMESMIQRVEDILVIDSLNVDRNDFFRFYRLSSAAGELLPVAALDNGMPAADQTVVYVPENAGTMIWGGPDGLMESRRLTDGTREPATFLGDELNAGGTANYPFLMPDGVTLYYAADGEDSLGGLDIYVSRRNSDGFPVPQNMGMPYNSPFNDFLLAIDEETGAGWWASDRNQIDSMLTIYLFIPNETRVNIDVNNPNLADRARLCGVSRFWDDKEELRADMLAKIEAVKPSSAGRVDDTPDFIFPMPDGSIYTRWSDFRNPAARRLMENYVDALAEFEDAERRLENLRAKARPSDSARILGEESRLRQVGDGLVKLANQVIIAETNH